MEPRELLAAFVVTNNSDAGAGTLRQAILDANSNPGPDIINFNIGAGGNQIIQVATELPDITSPVLFDGTTQPGYSGDPLVRIDGVLTTNANGLTFAAGSTGSTLRAMVVNRFRNGVVLNSSSNLIERSFIGPNLTGTGGAGNLNDGIIVNSVANTLGGNTAGAGNVISGNGLRGILLNSGANNNVIAGNVIGLGIDGSTVFGNSVGVSISGVSGTTLGGLTPEARNVISGNAFQGVRVSGSAIFGTGIFGNYIGTDDTGTLERGNGSNGILVDAASAVSIGGGVTGAGNVISGNTGAGILIQGLGSAGTVVKKNLIGTAFNGTSPIPNTREGIRITTSATRTVIGGVGLSEGNTIAFNGTAGNPAPGIAVASGTSHLIQFNSIFSNTGLGIDLGAVGVSPNQNTSPTSNLPNQGQNFPVLTRVESAAGQTDFIGTLNSIPSSRFMIQFFAAAPDPSGFGEGQTFLGETEVNTNGSGQANFRVRLPVGIPEGTAITATATDTSTGSGTAFGTSEFAQNIAATVAPTVDLQVGATFTTTPILLGRDVQIDVSYTNAGASDATNVVLTAVLPSTATFVSATAGTYNTDTRTLTLPVSLFAAGDSQLVSIIVTPSQTGVANVTATITSTEIDTDPSNNSTSLSENILPAVDLQLTVEAIPEPVAVGDVLTYIVAVTNTGPSDATNVVVTTTLPVTLGSLVVAPDEGTFVLNGTTLTNTLGLIPRNSTVTIRITGNPGQVGSIITSSSVTRAETDTDATNDSDSVTTTVAEAADLTLAVVATPNPVLAGSSLTYNVSVTNNGPSDATGAVLTYQLPSGVTLISANSVDGVVDVNGNTITVAFNAISVNGIVGATILVSPSQSGTLIGSFLASNQTEVDLNPLDNTVTSSVLVSPADLELTITNPGGDTLSGVETDVTLVVTNNGPATANNVLLTSILPSLLTFRGATVSAGGAFNIAGQTFTASIPSLASGASATIVLTLLPNAPGSADLTASVDADEFDPVDGNDIAATQLLIDPVDLAASVQFVSTGQVVVGSNLVYTLRVTNNGPATATGVTVTSPVLGAGALVSLVPSVGTAVSRNGQIVFNVGSLADGESAFVTVTFQVSAAATYTPVATASSNESELDETNNTARSSFSTINLPGTFVVAATTTSVRESDGFVTLRINRVLGNLGIVTVRFATANGTAIAGVNYTAVTGTLTFLDGETSKTLAIPIRRDGQVTPNLTFRVNLSSPTGGALLGQPNSTTVTVVNVDRDLVAPTVTGIQPLTTTRGVSGFLVTFSEPLDPASASRIGNYFVARSGRDLARPGADVGLGLASVVYVPGQNAVRITLQRAQPLNVFYKITIVSSNANAPKDRFGNALDGDFNGRAGGNFVGFNALGSRLRYTDSNGDAVSIQLTGGGTMSLTRSASGEGTLLNLIGISPRRSRINGTVRRLNGRGDGRTLINTITGFGKFGDVFSRLTTPPFFTRTQATSSSAGRVAAVVGVGALPKGPRQK